METPNTFSRRYPLVELLPLIPQGESIGDLESIVDELSQCRSWEMLSAIFHREDIKEKDLRESLFDEVMKAIRKEETNRFSGVEQSDATSLLCSFSMKEESWEDIHEQINCYFPQEND